MRKLTGKLNSLCIRACVLFLVIQSFDSGDSRAQKEAPAVPRLDPYASGSATTTEDGGPWAYPVDQNIVVEVDPVLRGPVVDRVLEPVTIKVQVSGGISCEIYIEPVDAPYGGRSLGEAKLLGRSSNKAARFPVRWSSPEPFRYVKLFAVVHTSRGAVRSKPLDMGVSGRLFRPGL